MDRVSVFWMSVADKGEANTQTREIAEVAGIVARTINGDPGAFEELIVRYERRVLGLALRFLGNMDEAQDAAQEVFLRVFKYIHRLDVQRPIEPWLMRMTVNVCRDLGRSRQRRQETFLSEALEPQSEDDPHSEFAERQQRQLLQKALKTLPEKERQAVVLRDVEGLSTAEVAEVLGSSETTVRSQICRARLKLKELLKSGKT